MLAAGLPRIRARHASQVTRAIPDAASATAAAARRLHWAPAHARRHFTAYTHYNGLLEQATARVDHVSQDQAAALLSQFISGRYDGALLRGFLHSDTSNDAEALALDDYLVILQMCRLLEVQDFDLVASLSESIRLGFMELYAPKSAPKTRRVRVADAAGADEPADEGSRSESRPPPQQARLFKLDTTRAPKFRDAVYTTCKLYNELKILYDPLFKTIGHMLLSRNEALEHSDLELMMRTYATQNYRDNKLVMEMASKAEDEAHKLDIHTAVSVYCSASYLEITSPVLTVNLEARFAKRLEEADTARFTFSDTLTAGELIDLGYAKFVQGSTDQDAFWFVKGVLEQVARKLTSDTATATSLTAQQRRKLTVTIAFLKCMAEPCYNTLADAETKALSDFVAADGAYRKFRTTKFVDKVSEHLTKLRIGHETNVYANGVLMDIMEKNRNVVWLCNSYHRFYAASFDPTAETKALERLIRAFGFKTCPINYYQWGRLRAKRTRFAYLRMARYYAINDQREYDHRYAGWSLPYVWWNVSRQDQMHISNYIKYDP